MSKVCVHVFFKARSGREEAAEEQLRWLADTSRRDAGCIQYDMHHRAEEPGRFMLYEQWESQEKLDAHLKMEYLADFREKSKDVLDGAPDVTVWKPL